jgi:hypothetical protein
MIEKTITPAIDGTTGCRLVVKWRAKPNRAPTARAINVDNMGPGPFRYK